MIKPLHKLSAGMHAMQQAVFLLNHDLEIVNLNHAAIRQIKKNIAVSEGVLFTEFFTASNNITLQTFFDQALQENTAIQCEANLNFDAGNQWFTLLIQPSEEVFFVYSTDISFITNTLLQQQALNKNSIQIIEELRSSNLELENFAYAAQYS